MVANKVANDLTLGQYSARDLNEARPHIEIPAAGLAAERRTEEELEHLKDIVQEMLNENDPEAWVNLDATFHSAVARASAAVCSRASCRTSATPSPTSPRP